MAKLPWGTNVALPWSVRESLEGAHEHFERLRAEIRALDEPERHTVRHEANEDLTGHRWTYILDPPFPGKRLGRMFGDGLNNLADALDHLVYAIAIYESGEDPPPDARVLQFPVMLDPPNIPMWRVNSLSEPVRTAILLEQPYPSDLEGSSLWQLAKLTNSKKHRVIHLTTTRYISSEVEIIGVDDEVAFDAFWEFGPLEGHTPFLTVMCDRPQPNVNVKGRAAADIGIQWIGRDDTRQDLVPLRRVIGTLEPGVRRVIERVANAARLPPDHSAPPSGGSPSPSDP